MLHRHRKHIVITTQLSRLTYSLLASIAVSPNGWTDTELGLAWIQDFEQQTREKANGRTRVLFLDGHSSHYSAALLRFALSHRIEIFAYPPHCTHALQGLDVVCFAKMKNTWKEVLQEFFEMHRCTATKNQFTGLFGKAYLLAFTPDTIRAAFSSTGIYPFNPDVISPNQLKPSETTSTTAAFPLQQTSPVRAVMAAFRYSMPSIDLDSQPTDCVTEAPALSSSNLSASALQSPAEPTSPMITSQKRMRSEDDSYIPPVDPSLYTPSKRIHLMTAALASTSSGSFLVDAARITSSHHVAPPVLEKLPPLTNSDWSQLRPHIPLHQQTRTELLEHTEQLTSLASRAKGQIQAQNVIIEGAQAQLVIQDLYANKLNETLFAKENRKPKNRTKIIFQDGKGRHLTHEKVVEMVEEMDRDRVAREDEKKQRKRNRAAKQTAREAVEIQWRQIKENHEASILAWNLECEQMRADGVPKVQWPKRPVRQRKPKPAIEADISDGEGSENGDNEDESDTD